MMLMFFFGLGATSLLAACVQNARQLAAVLTLLGAFAAIYHPVGIPMLVQHSTSPGATIGVNGLAGNLGVAVAAILTGFLIKWLGWRAAFGFRSDHVVFPSWPASTHLIWSPGFLATSFRGNRIVSPTSTSS
jgi:MFS family permease